MWKISGYPQKYETFEEAERILAKIERRALLDADMKAEQSESYAKEREEKLKQLAEDSTPYEIMIARNICLICNLEPCECFTYTKKTEAGQ
jgi:hypothetical protein